MGKQKILHLFGCAQHSADTNLMQMLKETPEMTVMQLSDCTSKVLVVGLLKKSVSGCI